MEVSKKTTNNIRLRFGFLRIKKLIKPVNIPAKNAENKIIIQR
jgi:hypothetical protein